MQGGEKGRGGIEARAASRKSGSKLPQSKDFGGGEFLAWLALVFDF